MDTAGTKDFVLHIEVSLAQRLVTNHSFPDHGQLWWSETVEMELTILITVIRQETEKYYVYSSELYITNTTFFPFISGYD